MKTLLELRPWTGRDVQSWGAPSLSLSLFDDDGRQPDGCAFLLLYRDGETIGVTLTPAQQAVLAEALALMRAPDETRICPNGGQVCESKVCQSTCYFNGGRRDHA